MATGAPHRWAAGASREGPRRHPGAGCRDPPSPIGTTRRYAENCTVAMHLTYSASDRHVSITGPSHRLTSGFAIYMERIVGTGIRW